MSIKNLHDYELGTTLKYSGTTVNVQPDNTGNVQFEVTGDGLKGNVALPQPFDSSSLEGTVASLTQRLEAVENRQIPTVPTNDEVFDAIKEKVVTAVLEAIKGEELQNLAGVTQGYLIKADA